MKILAVFVLILSLTATAAFGAPFQNGSFEIGSLSGNFVSLNAGSTAITGWEVTGAGVDYMGTYWQAADGSRSLDLNRTNLGGVQQTFDTIAGNLYQVTFSMSGNPRGAGYTPPSPALKALVAAADGGEWEFTFDTTGNSVPDNMNWSDRSFQFVSPGPNVTLSFTSTATADAFGPALDYVRVTDLGSSAPVPEPATMTLLGLGLGGLAAYGRKKFKK